MDRYIGITQPLNIVKDAYSNIDVRYGPYNNIEDALTAIPISLRKEGLTVGILKLGNVIEHWFNGGIEDVNLIKKTINKIYFTNEYFDTYLNGTIINESIYPIIADNIINFIDSITNNYVQYKRVTKWIDNTDMTDIKVDNIIYRKKDNIYYKRCMSDNTINVKWFGAKGDNSTFDSDSIIKAISYIKNLRKYSIPEVNKTNGLTFTNLYFPNGIYQLDKTIELPDYINIIGESTEGTILQMKNRNLHAIHIPPSTTVEKLEEIGITGTIFSYTYQTIEKITVAGRWWNTNPQGYKYDPANRGTGNGILIGDDSVFAKIKVKIVDVKISGFENAGLYITRGYYILLDRIQISVNTYGIVAENSVTTVMCDDGDIRSNGIGISLTNSFSCHFNRCSIEANTANFLGKPLNSNIADIKNKDGQGVVLNNTYNCTFNNCYFEYHIATIVFNKAWENSFNNCLFCPTPNYNPPTYPAHRLIKFYGYNNNGNKIINPTFVDLNVSLGHKSRYIDISEIDYGVDNEIVFSTYTEFDKAITENNFNHLTILRNIPTFSCPSSRDIFIENARKKLQIV